jgi:hypothetical protein
MFTRVSEPVRFHMPWSRSLAPVIPKIDHVDRDPLMIFLVSIHPGNKKIWYAISNLI